MTITFALILGHWAWSVEVVFVYDTWESQEHARLIPTDTPFLKMFQPWDNPGHDVVGDMVEAADNILNDPMNDPALQQKTREAGSTLPLPTRTRTLFSPHNPTGLRCAICGTFSVVRFQHDVDMCGRCHLALAALPPVTYISDGHGITRAVTFGSGLESFVVVMSFATLSELQRHEIGEAVATEYRRATAAHSLDRITDTFTKKQPDG